MIKKIIISACLFLSFASFAQEGTSSPYSFYGIGEAKFAGTVETRSMAGLSIAQDSTHINLQNPAALANLKWTAFSIGGGSNSTKQKTTDEKSKSRRTTLDYLSLGIPMGKFGAAFGLMPLSSVGYKITNEAQNPLDNNKRFNGWGGINRVFLGTGYRITPNWNVGVNAYYNFGKIQTNSLEYVTGVPIGSRELNVANMNGVSFNIGMTYKTKITEKLSIFSGLYYIPQSTFTSENTRSIGTVTYDSEFNLQVVEEFDDVTTTTHLKIPQKWSFGAGVGDSKKWFVGGEMSLQDVGELANDYNTNLDVIYGKYQKYSIGGYITPNSNPYMGYAKRITYRGGFKYEKTGLIVNSTSINDVGVTMGLGFPITGSLTNLNLGLELGKKGTTSANLVQENYFILSIGLSLNDKWFVKSKIY